MKIKRLYIYTIFLVFVFTYCDTNHETEEKPLAKVHEQYLYPSDIKMLFTENMSRQDSLNLANTIIDDWVKKQLMLKKAELNLTTEDTEDIEKQIDDYRTSLLIFKYTQMLVKQRLDTVITDEEIQDYYNQYSSNFVLKLHIVKAVYLKIPIGSPDIETVKTWYKSDEQENLSRLEDYSYQYAVKYDDFDGEWINFSNLLNEIPINIDDKERFLKYQRYLETDDSLFHYFVRIKDYRLKSTVQPIDYASSSIRTIILNKRKFTYLEDLEMRIYNNALNHNEFVIY